MQEVLNIIFSQIKKIPKQFIMPLGLGLLGLIVFGYGLIQYLGKNNSRENTSQAQDFTESTSNVAGANSASRYSISPTPMKTITIDVEGAVEKPGVYSINENSRVEDGLISAGGMSSNADRSFVAKQINLASKLTDGMKIYIPRIGEQTTVYGLQTKVNGVTTNNPNNPNIPNGGLVSINSASESDLEGLPGVGPVSAGKIISGRPYASVDELLAKKAVSKSTFEKIKQLIEL